MPEGQLKAIIWDMDGVIVDSAPFHFQAWQYVFHKRGVTFTEEHFKRHFGQRNDLIVRTTMGDNLSGEEVDVIASEKEASYRERITPNIKALPGALELIKLLHKNGFKMAIASSAPIENIQLILGGLDIKERFQAIVWGREVTEGKPSPQVYLLAAEKIAVESRNCLVIEDAIAGVTGARRAGMKCLTVTTNHPRESLQEADLVIDSLETVGISDLRSIFNR